ncbi:DUF3021 domain-containing protein [Gracilibacillus oryzae]|uniref:DUF3021 domain-containing protein n=1 Tax=Gracilibacillus oryzae TaxID=1672701 RepID=A0A7C8GUQ0_9BACI|nr:DUF3021 domain-containing protein [Gracilibacillus oryzae]KAB8137774.1 DUF3021 domain-containing protein [Gracilibacillus oryzae]
MIMEAIKRSITGIAFGGMITFIALTVVIITDTESSATEIWSYMLCSFIIGIYFGLSSFIFGDNGWSILKQTILHFILSIAFYLIIALTAGWTPWEIPAILLTSLIFLFIYAIFWTGYYLYYKKIEKSMNRNIQQRDGRQKL